MSNTTYMVKAIIWQDDWRGYSEDERIVADGILDYDEALLDALSYIEYAEPDMPHMTVRRGDERTYVGYYDGEHISYGIRAFVIEE